MVSGINGNPSPLNLQALQQGGDTALNEIRDKLFSSIDDPALAQQLAQKTLAAFQTVGLVPIDSPDLGAPRGGDLEGLDRSLQAAGDNVAFDMQMVMGLFVKLAQNMREANRNQRQAELTMQATALDAAAQKIRDAAQQRFTAAMVQGSMQIAAGAISIGAGAYGLYKVGGANQAIKGIDDKALQSQVFSNMMKKSDAVTQLGQGLGQATQGMGSMAGAGFERAASERDAEKAELDKVATLHQAARDSENDMMQQMQDIIRDIREKLAAIAQSNIETNRGIARNI